jgi:hypothetical protein
MTSLTDCGSKPNLKNIASPLQQAGASLAWFTLPMFFQMGPNSLSAGLCFESTLVKYDQRPC